MAILKRYGFTIDFRWASKLWLEVQLPQSKQTINKPVKMIGLTNSVPQPRLVLEALESGILIWNTPSNVGL